MPARSASSASARAEKGVSWLGWIDHGAAGGERGGGLAGDHRGGEVPGGDQGGDAGGLAPELDLGVVQVRGDALDVRAAGLLGVELDEARGIVDLAARLGERLALLAGHDAGEVLAGCDDQVVPAAEDGAALLRQQARPGGEGGLRRRRWRRGPGRR